MKAFKSFALLFLKGIAMGGADAIPGVSGGTIAFITGIYEKLLFSIKSFDWEFIRLVKGLRIKQAWDHVNGSFLVTLLSGIFLSLLSLAKVITYLLHNHPIQIWSFFFGLIIISSFIVLREIKEWKVRSILTLLAGLIMAFLITEASPAQTPDDYWFIFISGALAICAMILPGVSGAFILLIMGKYEFIYSSLQEFNLTVIAVFATGCAFGLLSFSRVISWLLKHYHNETIALLSGFMIGSLNKIWPWKQVIQYRINSKGQQVPFLEDNILPGNYFQSTGEEPFLLQALLFMALGVLIVFLLEKMARLISSKKIAKT